MAERSTFDDSALYDCEGMKPQCGYVVHWSQCRLDAGHVGRHSPGHGLDAAWQEVEVALPPGGRLTAVFEVWDADMRRIGHRGLVRSRSDAANALRELARLSVVPTSVGSNE